MHTTPTVLVRCKRIERVIYELHAAAALRANHLPHGQGLVHSHIDVPNLSRPSTPNVGRTHGGGLGGGIGASCRPRRALAIQDVLREFRVSPPARHVQRGFS